MNISKSTIKKSYYNLLMTIRNYRNKIKFKKIKFKLKQLKMLN